MGTTDKTKESAEQAIQKAQLNVLKFIAGVVVTSAIALIPTIISDHFLLKSVSNIAQSNSDNIKTNTKRIDSIEIAMPTKASRWSFGMQKDFSLQLEKNNREISVPDPKEIRDSHLSEF